MLRAATSLLLVFALLALAMPAWCADLDIETDGDDLEELLKPGPWEAETFVTSLVLPDAKPRSGSGELDTYVQRLRFRWSKNMGMGGFLTLETAYENRVYRLHGFDGLPASGVPSAVFHGMGFRVRYLQAVSERWAGFLFGRVRCEAEAGIRPTDGLSWAVSPGVGHRCPNGLNLGLGVAFIGRPKEGLYIVPGPQFSWKIDERWSAELLGTEFLLEHRFSNRWSLAFAAAFDSPRTRLNDSSPGLHGFFTDSRLPLQLRATWTPLECMTLELRVGVDVYRELFFYDRDGNALSNRRLDPAPHVGLRWIVRF